MNSLKIEKMRKCSYLLPHPGGDVVRELLGEVEQLQGALQSIADQTKCRCYKTEPGNTYPRHSSDCYWYIREEALEALEEKE